VQTRCETDRLSTGALADVLKQHKVSCKSVRYWQYATKQPGFNGHVTIWDGISGRGRECTGWMKFVLLTPVDGRLRVWRPRNTAFL
jgi:hypothetical protein